MCSNIFETTTDSSVVVNTALLYVCWCIDVFDNDGCDYGGSSRCLLTTLWSISWHITTAQSSSLCFHLAILHGATDDGPAGSIYLLSWTSSRHLLGSVYR